MSETAVADAERRLGDLAQRDVPIGPHTTYRVGGPAALFVEARDEADVALVADAVRQSGIAVLVVGKGSNLLVTDAGFPGLVLSLGDGFTSVDIADTVVRAGGAAALPIVARQTVRAGLTGFEWAVGVPGSIGGAVRMNAGGHGSDMAATLRRVRVVDLTTGEDGWVPADQLELRYRHSRLRAGDLVAAAEIGLRPGDRDAAEAEIDEIVRWRRANQPGGQNAGSVFTNPPGDSAGRLIDTAGAKGLRVGTAAVSPKHANFVIADADGRADDVWALMGVVQQRVWEAHRVWLEPETRLVGYEPNPRRQVET